jgi:hypothetical protein
MAKRIWDSIDQEAERQATASFRHSIAQPRRSYGRRTHKERKAALDGLYVIQRKMIKENYERF